ncbi:MAG TPA: substrate-binding domain-containing protein [Solirubrobacterales bacterium]|nr:substrate-binding domain-containing protein [Solirubrobacterales bacterium]
MLGFGIAACGGDADGGDSSGGGGGDSSGSTEGQIVGAGSVAQEIAQEVWTAGFKAAGSGESISYDAVGSAEGRRRFIEGEAAFAASDTPLEGDELTEAAERCEPGELIELPLYISPIVVFANLKLSAMELSPQTLAKVFNGEITRWDDQTIQRENPSIGPIGLPPKLAIEPVGLSEEPAITEQVTAYLDYEAPSVWDYGTTEEWPVDGSETASDAASVGEVVGAEDGRVGYIDLSHVGQLFGVTRLAARGGFFVEPSAQTTTSRLESAHLDKALSKGPRMLPVELEQKVPPGSYPLALVSYLIACTDYDSAREAAAVEAYVKYVAGRKGQEVSAESAGTAYAPPWLRKKISAAVG